jgi:hypothetical protein
LLYGTALLAEGGVPEDPAKFAGLLADRLARTLWDTPPEPVARQPKARVLLTDGRRPSLLRPAPDANDSHHQALRALGNRLVGILHGCLRHHTSYDERKGLGTPQRNRRLTT